MKKVKVYWQPPIKPPQHAINYLNSGSGHYPAIVNAHYSWWQTFVIRLREEFSWLFG